MYYRKSLWFSLIMVYISLMTTAPYLSLASPASAPAPVPEIINGNQPILLSRQQPPPLPLPPPPPSQPHNLQHSQMNQYTKATHDILLELRQQMLTKSFDFDGHFKQLLSSSKVSLHNMFADTYGLIYEKNTEIFTVMFDSLEQYYANGQVKISKSLESFFEHLYQKIFQFLNNNILFDTKYLECATSQLENLKPFQDMPERLIKGIKHAFVAARSFYQALNSGIDIIKSIISLVPSTQCTHLINDKLLFNVNQPGSNVRAPCSKFCEEVISRCIGKVYLDDLHTNWKGYVMALAELAKKLSTNYNMETIIAPLDVQISEAIMNFQENGTNISEHVFRVCGQPTMKPSSPLIRGERAANPASISSLSRSNQHISGNSQSMSWQTHEWRIPATNKQVSQNQRGSFIHPLDDLIEQKSPTTLLINVIQDYMLSTKSIWQQLPTSVCTSNYTRATVNKPIGGCFQEAFVISDINSDLRYRTEMQQQINRLAQVRSRIESALAGNEVDWNNDAPGSKKVFTTPAYSNTTPEPPTDDDNTDDPVDEDSFESSGEEPIDPEDGSTTDTDYPDYTQTETPTTPVISGNTIDEEPTNGGLYITPSDQIGDQKSSQTSSNPYIDCIVLAILTTHFVSLHMLRSANFPLS